MPTFRDGGQQTRQEAGGTGRTSTKRDSSTPAVRALRYSVSAGTKYGLRYSSFTHQTPLCTTQKTVRVTNSQLLFTLCLLLLFTTSTLQIFFVWCTLRHSFQCLEAEAARTSKQKAFHAFSITYRHHSQLSAPPVWYSVTRVSKKFFSFFRSIISDIQGNGLFAPGKIRSRPIC